MVAATNTTTASTRRSCATRGAARVPACDASNPERGDFHMSAAIRIGDLTIGVDSGGASPGICQANSARNRSGLRPATRRRRAHLARMRAYVKTVLSRSERPRCSKCWRTCPSPNSLR